MTTRQLDTDYERLQQLYYPRVESFLSAVAFNQGYQLQREILADYLDEVGLWREALGERWAARTNRIPATYLVKPKVSMGGWYSTLFSIAPHPQASLPPAIGLNPYLMAAYYEDPLGAERALFVALGKTDYDSNGGPVERAP